MAEIKIDDTAGAPPQSNERLPSGTQPTEKMSPVRKNLLIQIMWIGVIAAAAPALYNYLKSTNMFDETYDGNPLYKFYPLLGLSVAWVLIRYIAANKIRSTDLNQEQRSGENALDYLARLSSIARTPLGRQKKGSSAVFCIFLFIVILYLAYNYLHAINFTGEFTQ